MFHYRHRRYHPHLDRHRPTPSQRTGRLFKPPPIEEWGAVSLQPKGNRSHAIGRRQKRDLFSPHFSIIGAAPRVCAIWFSDVLLVGSPSVSAFVFWLPEVLFWFPPHSTVYEKPREIVYTKRSTFYCIRKTKRHRIQ